MQDNFGTLIRDQRKSLHLTQEDIATLLGVSISTVRSYEQGKTFPKVKSSLLLRELYGLDYEMYYEQLEQSINERNRSKENHT